MSVSWPVKPRRRRVSTACTAACPPPTITIRSYIAPKNSRTAKAWRHQERARVVGQCSRMVQHAAPAGKGSCALQGMVQYLLNYRLKDRYKDHPCNARRHHPLPFDVMAWKLQKSSAREASKTECPQNETRH